MTLAILSNYFSGGGFRMNNGPGFNAIEDLLHGRHLKFPFDLCQQIVGEGKPSHGGSGLSDSVKVVW